MRNTDAVAAVPIAWTLVGFALALIAFGVLADFGAMDSLINSAAHDYHTIEPVIGAAAPDVV